MKVPFWRIWLDNLDWEQLKSLLGLDRNHYPWTTVQTAWSSLEPISTKYPGVYEPNQVTKLGPPDAALCVKPRFTWGDFEAVSYCWESEKKEYDLILDETMIKVPRNLEAALQKVRQLPEVRSGMKVWVDALCIDQDSVEERNQQVSLMKEIYRYAATAVAWLGPHESWTDRAVNAIVNIDYLRRYRQHQHPSGAAYERWRTRHPWDDIRMLFQANYWTRLWVLQELALNQHRTLFLLGSRQLSRRMLISAAELCMDSAGILAAETSQAVLTGKNLFRSETLTAASQVFRLLQLNTRILEQKLNAVANVLNLSQNAKCKDPRDKVYGLLGLIPKEYRIPPDYRRTPSDLYMHFAEILLARGGMTDLLAWCGIDDNTDLPSWVPDWFEGFPRNHVEWLRRYKAGAPPMATVDMPGPLTPASVKSLLQCSCVVVDRISTTSARPSDYLPFHMTVDRRIGQCPGGSKVMTPNRYGSQTEVLMALQRTLVIYDPCRKLNAGVLTSQTAQADSALLCNIYWRDWAGNLPGNAQRKENG